MSSKLQACRNNARPSRVPPQPTVRAPRGQIEAAEPAAGELHATGAKKCIGALPDARECSTVAVIREDIKIEVEYDATLRRQDKRTSDFVFLVGVEAEPDVADQPLLAKRTEADRTLIEARVLDVGTGRHAGHFRVAAHDLPVLEISRESLGQQRRLCDRLRHELVHVQAKSRRHSLQDTVEAVEHAGESELPEGRGQACDEVARQPEIFVTDARRAPLRCRQQRSLRIWPRLCGRGFRPVPCLFEFGTQPG